jgi:hypothetical protein
MRLIEDAVLNGHGDERDPAFVEALHDLDKVGERACKLIDRSIAQS